MPGDVVWFPPGLKHWHGASPTTAMTHIAIQESVERKERRLDGEGQRRPIPANLIPAEKPRPLRDHQDHAARREVLVLEVNYGNEMKLGNRAS